MAPAPRRRVRPTPHSAAAQPLRRSRPETIPVRGSLSRGPRLARIGAWAALAAGPLALAAALVVPRGTTAQAAPVTQATSAPRPVADAAGTAAVFVDLWLRADAAAPDSPVTAAVRAMAPAADLPKRSRTEAAAPSSIQDSGPGPGAAIVGAGTCLQSALAHGGGKRLVGSAGS
ncbi:hypothetical protein [Streptomyces sp. NPDC002209]|uniref:hypothetical protein n=1 Tax=Streptomyces sp. NPDC002209 TaxID=3364638 RepID=UPI00367FF3DA